MRRTLEDGSCSAKTTPNNKNLVNNNPITVKLSELYLYQKFVIEIDYNDDDDLQMVESSYPATDYEISSFDKIIKDESNNNNNNKSSIDSTPDASRPNRYKATIIGRNPHQQKKFRNELLNHYKQCVITGLSWESLLIATYIMPFKQVGSFLNTGILLKREIQSLYHIFHISIDPETWTVLLSEEGFKYSDYSQYNNFKLPPKTVDLLKKADIQLLKQHYDKFKEMEYSRKHKI
jgi:hypothetical protein